MNDTQPTRIDKLLDVRRIAKYLSNNVKFRQGIESRIDEVEGSLQPSRNMIKSHLDFLDFLSEESRREWDNGEGGDGSVRDYRVEFVTWYLQHERGKRFRPGGQVS